MQEENMSTSYKKKIKEKKLEAKKLMTKEQLEKYIEKFYGLLKKHKLTINPSKVTTKAPGEKVDFLGFSYEKGKLDLSENTKKKIKGKIKRKADALRRWQRKRNCSYNC